MTPAASPEGHPGRASQAGKNAGRTAPHELSQRRAERDPEGAGKANRAPMRRHTGEAPGRDRDTGASTRGRRPRHGPAGRALWRAAPPEARSTRRACPPQASAAVKERRRVERSVNDGGKQTATTGCPLWTRCAWALTLTRVATCSSYRSATVSRQTGQPRWGWSSKTYAGITPTARPAAPAGSDGSRLRSAAQRVRAPRSERHRRRGARSPPRLRSR